MIRTLLTHKIYESCIDIFFDNIMKNFQISNTPGPQLGDYFTEIYDLNSGEVFYNCTIIPTENLSFYDDLRQTYIEDGMDINTVAFGIRFKMYEDEFGAIESFEDYDDAYGESTFLTSELSDIMFTK